MLNATKNRLRKINVGETFIEKRVVKASMLDLPYENNLFDAVLSNGVFHNVSDLREIEIAFGETSRILKNGGFLCFNQFSSNFIDPSLMRINDHIYLTKEQLPMALISKLELVSLLKKYGLLQLGEITEYEQVVSTGKRSIMRGVFRKV